MFFYVVLNLLIGLAVGFVFEFIYRSIEFKRIVIPKFINCQMYGLTAVFLVLIYFLNVPLIERLILIFLFPTIAEFITGYLYLKIKRKHLWNYFKEPYNFMGLVCLKFSCYWFAIALIWYYLLLPLTLK